MRKLISFIIKSYMGFFKKPDINEDMYLTFNIIHKPAVLGILGAIIGLQGYLKEGVIPEYYLRLKEIPIGIKPILYKDTGFQKTIITYTNTTGFSNKSGTTLIIKEQTLIKPSYKIYLLLDMDNFYQKKLYENLTNQISEYIPYMGKNEYCLWWNKNSVEEYYSWKKVEQLKTNIYKIDSIIMKKDFIIKNIAKLINFNATEKEFSIFEKLPFSFDPDIRQYEYCEFAYTTFKLKKEISNLYSIGNEIYVQLN